jgi:hypothetical protein
VTAYLCSARFFADAYSCLASAPRSPLPEFGHTVPASTRDVTVSPSSCSNSSGVAPTRPSTAKTQQRGFAAASRIST